MAESIQYVNPDGLMKNPAFTQVVVTQGPGKTIYIGGQNSVTVNREITGKGDLGLQTTQVMENIGTALAACGATFNNLVKLTIYIVQGQNAYTAFQSAQKFLATSIAPPAITVIMVAGLSNPDFLIEIDAVAFLSGE